MRQCLESLRRLDYPNLEIIIVDDDRETREMLKMALELEGYEVTQATVSRDIKELGLVKRAGDGAYQRPGTEATDPETALTALERAANEKLFFYTLSIRL